MIETGVSGQAEFKPFDFIDEMYDGSAADGHPIGLGLFDERLAEALDFSWLLEQVGRYGRFGT